MNDCSLALIEEPEIHLHPSAQTKLAEVLVELVREKNKTLMISTHSEHFVSSILTLVTEGKIKASDIACYLCKMENGTTTIEKQEVNSKGQIEGGLYAFMDAELDVIQRFLGVNDGNNSE